MASSESDARTGGDDAAEIERDLTAFQYSILVELADEAKYGLGIKRELETYYREEINHGRLYPNLDDLADAGLVEKSQLDERTNQYALTDRGREVVLDRFEMFVSKCLGGEDPREFERVLRNYRD